MAVIFISENDNLYEKLCDNNIDVRLIKKQIGYISSKLNNNKVGYFQFKIKKEYIKLCILPKTVNVNEQDEKIIQEKFLKYIDTCMNLMYSYHKETHLYKKIDDNYLDIINKGNIKDICDLDKILKYKYLYALNIIEKIIKKINTNKYKNKYYSDYSIKNKINIKKNIFEIDKSKVHQIGKESNKFSEEANIIYSVIQYFYKNKVNLIEDNLELKNKVSRLKRVLESKFEIIHLDYNIRKIFSYKTKRKFKTNKMKILYYNLLFLLDLEGYFNNYNNNSTLISKIENIACIIFDPALIFEYFVYQNECKKSNKVIFNRLDDVLYNNEIILYYTFINGEINNKYIRKVKSSPELIVNDVVKDCKWKVIDSINDINIEDIDKLKRDCIAHKKNNGVLVYPRINCDLSALTFEINEISTTICNEEIIIISIEECKI